MSRRGRALLLPALLVLAAPGLALLARDLLRPSPRSIARRVEHWRPLVCVPAREFAVDPALVLAVIAVESRGDPEAVSSAGARGLMQLLPPTAREMAAWLGDAPPEGDDLFDPAVNVRLGTAYLREQLDTFGEKEALALAAYHAGPRRVREWLDAHPDRSPLEVLELSAFPGTKAYVRHVLDYRTLIAAETPCEENR